MEKVSPFWNMSTRMFFDMFHVGESHINNEQAKYAYHTRLIIQWQTHKITLYEIALAKIIISTNTRFYKKKFRKNILRKIK